jgi:hypothetical protein
MKKLCGYLSILSTAGALFVAPVAIHATPITGNFSVTGTFIANDVASNPPGNGTSTLTFSDIASGAAATANGDFKNILVPFESSPSHGTIPYMLGGNTTYPSLFVEFDNPGNSADDLFVQILNLSASQGAPQPDGTFSYTYFGDVNFFVGSNAGGTFTPNPVYSETPGTFHFTAQDEKLGAVTFSGTALVPAATTVPEPSSMALLGTAMLTSAGFLRKRLLAKP